MGGGLGDTTIYTTAFLLTSQDQFKIHMRAWLPPFERKQFPHPPLNHTTHCCAIKRKINSNKRRSPVACIPALS